MKKFLFLVSGKAEAGKDTFFKLASELLQGTTCVTQRFAFGDEVKKVARKGFGWNGEKDEKGRELLQLIGDGARNYNPDIWIERTRDAMINDFISFPVCIDTYFFVTDCRYPNEIEKMAKFAREEDFEPVSIRVERRNHVSKLTEKQLQNPSEIALDNYAFDFTIWNDADLHAYKDQVREVLECLKLK